MKGTRKEPKKRPVSQEESEENGVLETECKKCFRKEGVWSALSDAADRLNKMQIDH